MRKRKQSIYVAPLRVQGQGLAEALSNLSFSNEVLGKIIIFSNKQIEIQNQENVYMCIRHYLLKATIGTSKYDPTEPFKSLKTPIFLDHFLSTKSGVLRVSDNPHTLLMRQFRILR